MGIPVRMKWGSYFSLLPKDIKLRDKYIDGESFEADILTQVKFLDTSMKSSIGVSYSEFLDIIYSISSNVQPITSPGKIPMVDKEDYFRQISDMWSLTFESVNKIFSGITLDKEMMVSNEREIWDYKQPNRMSKRPFLEINYLNKKHLIWSNSKLNDFFTILQMDLPFKQFPKEWRSKNVNKTLSKISNEAGKWFENQVKQSLLKIGIIGNTFEKVITDSNERLYIDKNVGGLDFFGYSLSDNLLILIECKMLNSGFESKGFRQERDKFMNPKNGFLKKIRLKYKWVIDNYESICQILAKNPKFKDLKDNAPRALAVSFVTYYATMTSCYLEEVPCVTLPELMEEYQSNDKWPFEKGIFYFK